MGMLGGWYSDPGEQQPVKKTASVRVDTALGPEWHQINRAAPSAQAPPQVQQQQAVLVQGQPQLSRAGMQRHSFLHNDSKPPALVIPVIALG